MAIAPTPIAPPLSSTHGYCTSADMENLVGITNVSQWSNVPYQQGMGANTATVQAALNWADGQIVGMFRNYGNKTVPLAPLATGIPIVNSACTQLACWKLYTARGLTDTPDPKYDKFYRLGIGELAQYLSGTAQLDASDMWPQPTGPVSVSR